MMLRDTQKCLLVAILASLGRSSQSESGRSRSRHEAHVPASLPLAAVTCVTALAARDTVAAMSKPAQQPTTAVEDEEYPDIWTPAVSNNSLLARF